MGRVALGTMIACAIAMLSGACRRPASTPVTFNKHVAPIVFANCVTCHRPGGDGPFSLLTYADAARHATEIGDETRARHMPPWLPEPGDVPIVGVRSARRGSRSTPSSAGSGTAPLEGAAADLPAPPSFSSDWQLGTPDAVLTMPRPYVLNPGSRGRVSERRSFTAVVPDDVFIRAVELRRNGSPIHHAVVRLARVSRGATLRRRRRSAWIQRDVIGDPSGSGRPVPGMGAGSRTDGLARWHAVASRARHRSSCWNCTSYRRTIPSTFSRASRCISPARRRRACRSRP